NRSERSPNAGRGVAFIKPSRVLDGLGDRPVRDPLAVRKATPARDKRAARDLVQELLHEPRLADARRAEHREQLARRPALRLFERVEQTSPLALSADDR